MSDVVPPSKSAMRRDSATLTEVAVPYYRGKGYGPGAWVLLIGIAGLAVFLGYTLLRHASVVH